MPGIVRRAVMFSFAGLALLIVGAVGVAQHHPTLTQILSDSVKTVGPATKPPVLQQSVSNGPLVKLLLTGAVERDGETVAVEKAGPVKPGEVVSFTMNSVNDGTAPAREYRAIGQIPRGATFVANSAQRDGNTHVSYSIDNGQQFSANPMIDQKQADGTIKKVPAPVSLFTQVRFEWADPLAPGGKLVASYQVRVK